MIIDCLRYWVTRCTSTASGSTWRRSCPAARTASCWRTRRCSGRSSSTTDAGRHQDHRRGLGRRRPLPGRLLPRLALGGVERPVTATTSAGSSRATRAWSARWPRGSPASRDLYQHDGELPINSINFITCHDGFTLNDLVSYNEKHNEANGEDNRDGANDNHSWNCGVEGHDRRPEIEALRRRQIKNFADDPAALARACRCSRRRRGPPHPARQQQRLLPGQRDQLVRLDASPSNDEHGPVLPAR